MSLLSEPAQQLRQINARTQRHGAAKLRTKLRRQRHGQDYIRRGVLGGDAGNSNLAAQLTSPPSLISHASRNDHPYNKHKCRRHLREKITRPSFLLRVHSSFGSINTYMRHRIQQRRVSSNFPFKSRIVLDSNKGAKFSN